MERNSLGRLRGHEVPRCRGIGFLKRFKEAIGPKSSVGQIISGLECWDMEILGDRELLLPDCSNNRVTMLGNIYLEITHQMK